MTSSALFQNAFILRRLTVAIFADIIKIVLNLLKQSLKIRKKLKEFEIMHQNAI